MADVIARVSGVALVPGVSKNKRLYTTSIIRSAVERAQERIAGGGMPITALTHHAAGDDSTRIVGRVTKLTVDDDGRALYEMDLANTEHARDLLNLIDTKDGAQFLAGVSIRGAWIGPVKKQSYNGEMVETGDDLELDGLDFTKSPGVDGANIAAVSRVGGDAKESNGRHPIFETLTRANVEVFEEDMERNNRKRDNDMEDAEEDAEEDYMEAAKGHSFKNGVCQGDMHEDMDEDSKEPHGDVAYADPGYQDDKVKRYPVDSAAHVRSAWSYINQSKNAAKYSSAQLAKIKGRIKGAAKKYGIKIATEGWVTTSAFQVTENGGGAMLPGGAPLFKEDPYAIPPLAGFCVALNNRLFNVIISSSLIDPADLEVVADKAMSAACAAVAVMDPDCDGDIDIDIDGDEDTDDDAKPAPMGNSYTMPESATPQTPTAEAAGEPTEQEAPAMAEETHAPEATEEAAPAPAASAVEAKLDALTAAITGLVEKLAAPAPAVEAAPEAPVAEAKVEETEEARIERLVAEKLTAAVQKHAEEVGVGRKGLVAENAAAQASFGAGDFDYPEGWPAKPLHEYTPAEVKKFLNPALEQAIMGPRSIFRQQ